MLRLRLHVLQTAVRSSGCLRSARQPSFFLTRRISQTTCSQRKEVAHAPRQLIAISRTCSRAIATTADAHIASEGNGAAAQGIAGAPKLTFQEAITALEQYWAKQSGVDCAILLPHNTEVRNVCPGRRFTPVMSAAGHSQAGQAHAQRLPLA